MGSFFGMAILAFMKEKPLIVYFGLFKEAMKLFANWTRIRKEIDLTEIRL